MADSKDTVAGTQIPVSTDQGGAALLPDAVAGAGGEGAGGLDTASASAPTPATDGSPVDGVAPPPSEQPGSQRAEASRPGPSKGAWPKSAIERVAKLTARLKEYEARGVGAPKPINPETGQMFTAAEVEALVNERAALMAQQDSFNRTCNEVARRGSERFGDWQTRLDSLRMMVDPTDRESQAAYDRFLSMALEMDEPEIVIHRLGLDLNEAGRVLSLPPAKMAIEIAKIATGGAKGQPSNAPRPIKPLGSTNPVTSTRPDDPQRGAEIPMSDWMKARSEQAKERRIR